MKLSKHFNLTELTRSATAEIRGIENIADDKVIASLTLLCTQVLEPLREILGEPILISSGYRSEKVNRLVGGVASSQHLKGEAADVYSNVLSPRQILKALEMSDLVFDQAILYNTFVHISYKSGGNRMQTLYKLKT